MAMFREQNNNDQTPRHSKLIHIQPFELCHEQHTLLLWKLIMPSFGSFEVLWSDTFNAMGQEGVPQFSLARCKQKQAKNKADNVHGRREGLDCYMRNMHRMCVERWLDGLEVGLHPGTVHRYVKESQKATLTHRQSF